MLEFSSLDMGPDLEAKRFSWRPNASSALHKAALQSTPSWNLQHAEALVFSFNTDPARRLQTRPRMPGRLCKC